MNMRVSSNASSRPPASTTTNNNTSQDTPSGTTPDPAAARTNQMRDALNNYILNNGINAMQKKTNKTEQAHKKNVAKQKEHKAEQEE